MSRYHAAVRQALVAALTAAPAATAPVFSNPPTNQPVKMIMIGDIVAEAPVTKGEPDGFYVANIEIWSQTFSPAEVDTLADWVVSRLCTRALVLTGRTFGSVELIDGEEARMLPAEAGGPVFGRVLPFRFYVA